MAEAGCPVFFLVVKCFTLGNVTLAPSAQFRDHVLAERVQEFTAERTGFNVSNKMSNAAAFLKPSGPERTCPLKHHLPFQLVQCSYQERALCSRTT